MRLHCQQGTIDNTCGEKNSGANTKIFFTHCEGRSSIQRASSQLGRTTEELGSASLADAGIMTVSR
jgi:hypothetical protein